MLSTSKEVADLLKLLVNSPQYKMWNKVYDISVIAPKNKVRNEDAQIWICSKTDRLDVFKNISAKEILNLHSLPTSVCLGFRRGTEPTAFVILVWLEKNMEISPRT